MSFFLNMSHLAAYKAYLDQGRRVFTDSRKVIPDGVFVALKGPSFDGNQYALEALSGNTPARL